MTSERHKNPMHSSFSLLCAARTTCWFISYNYPVQQCWVDNNEDVKSVCKHSVPLPVTPNKDISGTSQKSDHTHLQIQGHCGKGRRIMSEHTYSPAEGQSHGDTVTPAAMCMMSIEKHTEVCMHTHTWSWGCIEGSNTKINTAAKLGDNGWLVQEEQTQWAAAYTHSVCLSPFVGTSPWV